MNKQALETAYFLHQHLPDRTAEMRRHRSNEEPEAIKIRMLLDPLQP